MPDSSAPFAAVPFAFPGLPGIGCLFAGAGAGDMSLAAGGRKRQENIRNRKNFMRLAGFSRWAELHQVHGTRLVSARTGGCDDGELEKADGHFTREKNTGLIIKTADCQPLLFARRDGGAAAALHVGWRGNAAGFPGAAVRQLCTEFSCPPADLLAVRGPSLGPAAAEFVNFTSEWPPEFAPWFDPEFRTVNLWALTRRQLTDAGMLPENIFSLDLCTRSLPEFFSYRRGDTGRQVSAVWIKP